MTRSIKTMTLALALALALISAPAHAGPWRAVAPSCPGGRCPANQFVGAGQMVARPPAYTYAPAVPRPTPAVPGSGPGACCWVWLHRQGVWGFGWRRADGLWTIQPGSKRKPVSIEARAVPGAVGARVAGPTASVGAIGASPADHRGRFLGWLNNYRARCGLRPVGYDAGLESWAAQNNAAQRARGMGHHVMQGTRRQNAAWGSSDPAPMWASSPAHNDALLDPTITAVGLAWDGAYWTYNAN